MSNIAIIFAGGVGSRMRYRLGPKQFMEVNSKPILIYTLDRFEQHKKIDKIYLIITKSHISKTRKLIRKFKINKVRSIVGGGDSAHESIMNGLEAAHKDGAKSNDVVLIHDGVRPIIDSGTIDLCIRTTKKLGNAITSLAAYETVAESENNKTVKNVLKRDMLYTLQAPQTFLFKDAYSVNEQSKKDGLVGKVVDQAELNMIYGNKLNLITGIRGNVKITVPLDFTYFEFLVKSGRYKKIVQGEDV